MQSLSPILIEFCFREAAKFIPKIYFDDILFNPVIIKSYNIYAIENLKFDIETLDNYFCNISLTYPGFEDCLIPIKEVLAIFFSKRIDGLVEANRKLDFYYQIKYEALSKFLFKYKNLKKTSDLKGKISESEISSLIKKLKEIKK